TECPKEAIMTIPEAVLALSRSPELSVLLKATVLVSLALAVVRMAGRERASVRHLVLASTFAALAALPLVIAAPGVRVDIAITPSEPVRGVAAAPIPAVISPSTAASAAAPVWVIPSWTTILRVLWAAGAMLQLGFLAWQLLRLRRIQRAGVPWLEGRDLARTLAGE